MTNVFDGQSDQRQSDDQKEPMSRFRPRYRALSDDEKALHDAIKAKAEELEALFQRVTEFGAAPHSDPIKTRYRALGLTALEQSVMWAVKALTS